MVSLLPQRQEPVLSGSNEALWGGEGVPLDVYIMRESIFKVVVVAKKMK